MYDEDTKARKLPIGLIATAIIILIMVVMGFKSWTTVEAGHVGVKSTFGSVSSDALAEGSHFINPFSKVQNFDARQKTLKAPIGMPSADQLITNFDISVQYRLIKEQAASMLKETGTPEQVVEVHLQPLLRSKARELGKSVATAEEFYSQETQLRIQTELLVAMGALAEKGIKVENILIRDVKLPQIITDAVARKKKAAQDAEKAKEELKKFEVDQQRKEAQATAEKKAEEIDAAKHKEVAKIKAESAKEVAIIKANALKDAASIEAEAIIIQADAKKYAIKAEIDAVGTENYVRLKSLEALKSLQSGNHVIIMDPSKTNPLPFMNLTPVVKK